MPRCEFDDIHEFLLVADADAASGGTPPRMTGEIHVDVRAAQGLPNATRPLDVVGTFRIKEIEESGCMLSIHSIEEADVHLVE